jgi:hypothetical protein
MKLGAYSDAYEDSASILRVEVTTGFSGNSLSNDKKKNNI